MKYRIGSALFLAAVLLLSAAGCGGTALKQDRHLTAETCTDERPFLFEEGGAPAGFEADLLRLLAARAGYTAELRRTSRDSLFAHLQRGYVDLALSGAALTPEEARSYRYSSPYFLGRPAILTADPSIASAGDLRDKITAVVPASPGQFALEARFGRNAPQIRKTAAAADALLSGEADALVGDMTYLQFLCREYPDRAFRIVEDARAFPPERFVILYPKNGDPEVRRALGQALSSLIADGTYAALYRKWFGEEPPPALRDAVYGK